MIRKVPVTDVAVGARVREGPNHEWFTVAEVNIEPSTELAGALDIELVDTEGNGELFDDTESVEVLEP